MKKLIAGVVVALASFSCAPQCESVSSSPQTVCRRADAGAIAADAPFVVEGETFVNGGACSVTVDGGAINLSVAGMACTGGSANGALAPAQPQFIKCNVPALPAGTYVVTTSPSVTFTIPGAADGGFPNCQ